MVLNVYEFINSTLYRVFRKHNRPDGIHVSEAIEMMRDMEGMAAAVKSLNKHTPLSAEDREYVEKCVNTLELYERILDIGYISRKYRRLCNQVDGNMVRNYPVIQNLSLKIHLMSGISYWYVQRYILAKLYAHDKYTIYSSDKGTDFSWIHSKENNELGNMIIDIEMSYEKRFDPLPPVTTLEAREISKLQDCVLGIGEMCVHLPEDIQEIVRLERRPVDYTINPNTMVHCILDEASGNVQLSGAKSLVALAYDCGGIKIKFESAFWIICILPSEIEDWIMIFDESFNDYLCRELRRFPRIDQGIIEKVKAVLVHPVYRPGIGR